MKNIGLYLMTASVAIVGTFGFVKDANAANNGILLVSPPSEQQSYSMKRGFPKITEKPQTEAVSPKTTSSAHNLKESTLKRLEQLRQDSAQEEEQGQSEEFCIKLLDTPRVLYKYSRLLDYSPHPSSEELLKQTPVLFNNNQYWFNVTYLENWKGDTESTAVMTGMSFRIDVMENNSKVRSLETPKFTINSKKLKKNQIIGIAEVAPFKFNIVVEDFKKNSKGVTELIFKLELVG